MDVKTTTSDPDVLPRKSKHAPKKLHYPTKFYAFKFLLDPNPSQLGLLKKSAAGARVAYNMMTAENLARIKRYRELSKELTDAGHSPEHIRELVKKHDAENPDSPVSTISWSEFSSRYLTPLRKRHESAAKRIAGGEPLERVWNDEHFAKPWFHTVKVRVQVSGLQNADKAMKNYFNSVTGAHNGKMMGLPRFKKSGVSRDSFTIPAPETFGAKGTPYLRGESKTGVIGDYRHVRLAFLGTIRTVDSTKRLVKAVSRGAELRSFTVSRSADRWYVSILVRERDIPVPPTKAQVKAGVVGMDLGANALAALSTGEVVDNPRHRRGLSAKLSRKQQAFARTQKGSNHRIAAAREIATISHLVSLQRATTQHHLTSRLTRRFAVVALEDLNVMGMTSSAKGTVEKPGKNVTQKAGLNREILDVGFGEIRRQIEYKAKREGSQVFVVDRFEPTSQVCSSCGERQKMPLSSRVYRCGACGFEADRDVNAAMNIRAVALRGTGERS